MPGRSTSPEAPSVEIEPIEQACRQLLAALGPGGYRGRLERSVVHGSPGLLLGRKRELLVDGVVVWRARWVADGSGVRLQARWLVDPESFRE